MCNPNLPELIDNDVDINDDSNTSRNNISINSISSEFVPPPGIGTNANDKGDPNLILSDIRKNNVGRLIIGHLNINSLRNKFEALKNLMQGKVDIFIISETKIDESFPLNQFLIDGFSAPFRLDRNDEGGGIIIYIRDDIPCKELTSHLPSNIEGIFIELNLRKKSGFYLGDITLKRSSFLIF